MDVAKEIPDRWRLPHAARCLFGVMACFAGMILVCAGDVGGADGRAGGIGPSAAADVLTFANGDRISGLYLGHEDGFIHFESEQLGLLRIPETAAVVAPGGIAPIVRFVPIVEAPPVAPDDEPAAEVAGVEPEAGPAVEEEPEELPPGTLHRIPVVRRGVGFVAPILDALKQFHLWPTWKSRVTFGHVWQYGQVDQTSINAGFTTEKRVPDEYEARFDSRYNYAKQRRADQTVSKTRDDYNLRLRYRHIFATHFFAHSSTRYEKDLIKRIRHEAEQSLGVGWRIFERENTRATITPAFSTRYQDRRIEPVEWFVYMSLFQDLEYRFNEMVSFHQEASYSIEATDSENYNFDFKGRLETMLTAKLSLNLIWDFKFDNAVAAGIDPSMHRTTAALAFDF